MTVRRKPRSAQLTLWDRLVYGALAALFGSVLGAILAATLMLLFETRFMTAIFVFSAGFFFLVGFLRGAQAGEFAGEAVAHGAAIAAAMGDGELDAAGAERTGGISWFWLWVCYAAGIAAIVFLR